MLKYLLKSNKFSIFVEWRRGVEQAPYVQEFNYTLDLNCSVTNGDFNGDFNTHALYLDQREHAQNQWNGTKANKALIIMQIRELTDYVKPNIRP